MNAVAEGDYGPKHRLRPRAAGKQSRPERVGTVVHALLDRIGIRGRVERAATAASWADSVGPHIARVTRATRVRGRTLFVEVENASWLTELNMMKRSLLEGLNQDRKSGRIDRIVFVQADGDGSTDMYAAGRRRARKTDSNERGRG
jgi:predicted nucleic acid-binding Zn ribbon protein